MASIRNFLRTRCVRASARTLFVCIGMYSSNLLAMQFVDMYEVYFRQVFDTTRRANMAIYGEGGWKGRGYNRHSECVNVLQLWQPTQSSLAMLKGFNEDSPEAQALAIIDAYDDGVRGHWCVRGSLHNLVSAAFATRVAIRHDFMLGIYLPVHHAQLSNVTWCDLTRDNNAQDMRVKEELTDHFFQHVHDFDPTLNISSGWQRTGVGDLTLLMEWQHDFPQPKPVLKIVQVNTRLGMSFPTGLRHDNDLLLGFPFGYDGATGLIFGGCLNLNFMHRMWAGVDVELTHLFDSVSTRRIKVDPDQTELLLLAKACVHNDWGMMQRFNLFLTADPVMYGLSCSFYYQFLKHGRTDLIVGSNDFDSMIANTAESLKEWVTHTAIFRATYDFAHHMAEETRVHPSLSFFARIPFKARRAAVWNAAGVMLNVAF